MLGELDTPQSRGRAQTRSAANSGRQLLDDAWLGREYRQM